MGTAAVSPVFVLSREPRWGDMADMGDMLLAGCSTVVTRAVTALGRGPSRSEHPRAEERRKGPSPPALVGTAEDTAAAVRGSGTP